MAGNKRCGIPRRGVSARHRATNSHPIPVKITRTLQQAFRTTEAPSQPPGFGQSFGVACVFGHPRLPLSKSTTGRFQNLGATVQGFWRGSGKQLPGTVDLRPCNRQLLDYRRGGHLNEFRPQEPRSAFPGWWRPNPPDSSRFGTVPPATEPGWPDSSRERKECAKGDRGCRRIQHDPPIGRRLLWFSSTIGQFLDVLRMPRFGGGQASVIDFHIGMPTLAD